MILTQAWRFRLLTSLVYGLGLTFVLSPLLWSACRMARGQEATSTSQVGRKRRPTRGMPSASSIISSLTMEELRAYCDVLDNIDLKLMEELDEFTLGGEHNAVFFTQDHLAAGHLFPVLAIVKQFLHFTRASPTLVHPNTIRILTGCSVLNLLYQLDLSLVEICFAYSLRVAQGGRMSMSAQSSRLQFLNGLLDSPKMEAKGVTLVRGPWDETSGSSGLPFDVNRSQFFLGVRRGQVEFNNVCVYI